LKGSELKEVGLQAKDWLTITMATLGADMMNVIDFVK
jgi:hypothetical protein